MSLSKLKKAAKGGLANIEQELNKFANESFKDNDEGYWAPTVDKAGNGYAVIRFLPAPDGEDSPIVRYYDHSFSRNGKWYIEKSRTSLGKEEVDPVSEYNSILWNTDGPQQEANRELVSGNQNKKIIGSKRRQHFVANILVVEDQGNPENNGKVFLYRFGLKIFEKLKLAVKPEFPDVPAINPYCFWNGANFALRIRKVAGQRNYDASSFLTATELSDNEETLETIWSQCRSLSALVAPDKFKTYDVLAKRLALVLGDSTGKKAGPTQDADDTPVEASKSPLERPSSKGKTVTPAWEGDDIDEDDYFKKIAEEE